MGGETDESVVMEGSGQVTKGEAVVHHCVLPHLYPLSDAVQRSFLLFWAWCLNKRRDKVTGNTRL